MHREITALLDRPSLPAAPPDKDFAASLFQQEWRIYRKVVEANYLFHAEAYRCLRRALVEDVARPFHFLDLACGDASASVAALAETRIASYRGLDLSADALDLARAAVSRLPCPAALRQQDFVQALASGEEPADVIWIGLSLHHLRAPAKREALRAARRTLDPGGVLLVYENTSPDGEDREAWLERWDRHKPDWTALTPEEWWLMRVHVHDHDFPETVSRWRELGVEAGFGEVRELFVSPTDMFRLFAFEG